MDVRVYKRYSAQERAGLIDNIVEEKFRTKDSWDELADRYNVDRSTLWRWRGTDEWKISETRWRRVLREEARTTAAETAGDMLDVLTDLAFNAKSEFVRMASASKVIDVVGLEDEIEEIKNDQNNEFLDWLKKFKHKPRGTLLDIEVEPGGFLPPSVIEANKIAAETIDAEFTELEDTPETPLDPEEPELPNHPSSDNE